MSKYDEIMALGPDVYNQGTEYGKHIQRICEKQHLAQRDRSASRKTRAVAILLKQDSEITVEHYDWSRLHKDDAIKIVRAALKERLEAKPPYTVGPSKRNKVVQAAIPAHIEVQTILFQVRQVVAKPIQRVKGMFNRWRARRAAIKKLSQNV